MAKNDVDKLHKQKGKKQAYHSHESREKCVGIFSTPNSGRRMERESEREGGKNNEGIILEN